jgi:hypothetical protein
MKKLWVLFLLFSTKDVMSGSNTSMAINAAAAVSKAASSHYIINLTGRTILLNFYAKNPFNGKSTWYSSDTFGPLIIAGKSTTNILDTLNYQLLPSAIDMHTNTSFKVTVDAFKFNDKKAKDPKIHGTSMPTPATSPTPNDFRVTLDGDQLVITKLDTCMGIKIKGATKEQWPSAENIKFSRMTPAEKIPALQQKNIDLGKEITKLKKQIKKESNLTKINNRKKMIANKKERIKKNEGTIKKIQAEIAAASAQPNNPPSSGGTVAYNPETGKYSSAACSNGICPQSMTA